MNVIYIVIVIILVFWLLYKLLSYKGGDVDNYNRNLENYDKRKTRKSKKIFSFSRPNKDKIPKKAKRQNLFTRIFFRPLPFDDEAIIWCANFLLVDKNTLINILRDTSTYYSHFKIGKRSGGFRTISAPQKALLVIQKTIYKRIFTAVNVHSAATGFRPNKSIIDNAKIHLGKSQVLKVDIVNFFGSIKRPKVIKAFEKIGYPTNISEVLAELCVLNNRLPQGAPTSPALSNIIAHDIDVNLTFLSQKNSLSYTRYADDLTFSGDNIEFESILYLLLPVCLFFLSLLFLGIFVIDLFSLLCRIVVGQYFNCSTNIDLKSNYRIDCSIINLLINYN